MVKKKKKGRKKEKERNEEDHYLVMFSGINYKGNARYRRAYSMLHFYKQVEDINIHVYL